MITQQQLELMTAEQRAHWKLAGELAVTMPISPANVFERLVAGDTPEEIRVDVDVMSMFGVGGVLPYVYERRRRKAEAR